jgi:hypothetical protein
MAMVYGGDKYKDLWHATLPHYETKLQDMLPRSHPLLAKIAGNENIKGKSLLGKRFVERILARAVENVQSIYYRQEINTDYVQLLETIEVEPKLCYQGVTISDKELAINSTNELIDLLDINEKAVREGFMRFFARTIYESGAPFGVAPGIDEQMREMYRGVGAIGASPAGTKLNGLPYMISENPYVKDLYVYNLLRGGTDALPENNVGTGNIFWRNRAGELLMSGEGVEDPEPDDQPENFFKKSDKDQMADKLIDAMSSMIIALNGVSEVGVKDEISPVCDCIFMNYRLYMIFQYAKYKKLHVNNVPNEKIDLGFTKLEHMGIPVYLDKYCPMNKIYFLDSSQIEMLYVNGENFKREVKEMPNFLAKRYITTFIGNFIIHKARNCGVIVVSSVASWTDKINEHPTGSNGLPDNVNVCIQSQYTDEDYPQPQAPAMVGTGDWVETKGYSGSGVDMMPGTTPEPAPAADRAAGQKKGTSNNTNKK